MKSSGPPRRHIALTSHPQARSLAPPIRWGAPTPAERGPIVGTLTDPNRRNAIGVHSGPYALYRALAVSAGTLNPVHLPDFIGTAPTETIGPHPQWSDPEAIVSIDPFGHVVVEAFADLLKDGWDIRPTIAVTAARIHMPEVEEAVARGRLSPDGAVLLSTGEVKVTKIAIEQVWYLPGVARRCGVDETELRRTLFEQTGGMFPELITRRDLQMFLPPVGGATVYCFGNPAGLTDPARKVACRVHDECSGSDVFGSDICTCRPYLVHGIEVCITTAQEGGTGIIVYNRKEGRGLGEVTKFLVYNARKRQPDGDRAETYFERTECVAGVQDVRFQELMPDVLHWLGVKRIDRFVSMSNTKYDAITRQGIAVVERVELPDDRVPGNARVEIEAKKAAGYYTKGSAPDKDTHQAKTGRTRSER